MKKSRLETVSFLVLLGAIVVLTFAVFKPFLQVLTLAAVLAILFDAPYERLVRLLRGQRSIAAIIWMLLVIIFLVVPVFILGSQIFIEAQGVYTRLAENGSSLTSIQNAIQAPIQKISPHFVFSVSDYVTKSLGFISDNLGVSVSQTVWVIFYTFLILLTLFFFLRDGRVMLAAVMRMSPLETSHTEEIFKQLHQTVVSVIHGTLVVAIIRWFLISIGFYLFGIPNAILWGSIGGIIGAIPGLGTLFVIAPAALYLYVGGNVVGAIGLALYGLVVIGFVDNVMGPYFFGRGLEVQPIFVLFSILGGIIFFGPMGFILGPLILSVFLSLMHMYSTNRAHEERNLTS